MTSQQSRRSSKKKPYAAPVLTVYGSIKKITKLAKSRRVKDVPGPKKT